MTKAKEIIEHGDSSNVVPMDDTPTSVLNIIATSVAAGGTDVAVLEKMFDLYERDEARKAAKLFDAAMSEFQGTVKPIRRIKKADRFTYAPIEEIIRTIQGDLSANGLSVRFDTKFESDGYITAYCTVSHVGGHKERSEFTCPVDKENKQRINVAQQQASANSYARRYALSNALNLVYSDEDDDGNAAGTQFLTTDQAIEIKEMIIEKHVDEQLFFKWVGVDTTDTKLSDCYALIPANWYARIKREYT